MKKFMILFCLMLMSTGAFAQRMFVKPMVGATLSTLNGDVQDTNMRLGLGAGAEFGYMFSERFGATAGLLFSMQSCKFRLTKNFYDAFYDYGYDFTRDYHTTTFNYLNIPVLANYYLLPGFAIKAGVQPGFLLSANSKWFRDGIETSSSGTENLKKFSLSIPLGLSYEFSNFIIDARYHFGLTDILEKNYLINYKSRVIMVTVGYNIPF